MADINNVVLVGRLTRDAELKYTNTGLAVSKMGLAINRRRKQNNEWVEEANFFDVTVWGKTAEALQPYLKKGKQIGVHGELRQSRWEQDGQSRSRVEIVANNIQLLGGNSGGGGGGGGMRPQQSSGSQYQQGGGYNQQQGGGYNQQQGGGYNQQQGGGYNQQQGGGSMPAMPADDFEDDIPF